MLNCCRSRRRGLRVKTVTIDGIEVPKKEITRVANEILEDPTAENLRRILTPVRDGFLGDEAKEQYLKHVEPHLNDEQDFELIARSLQESKNSTSSDDGKKSREGKVSKIVGGSVFVLATVSLIISFLGHALKISARARANQRRRRDGFLHGLNRLITTREAIRQAYVNRRQSIRVMAQGPAVQMNIQEERKTTRSEDQELGGAAEFKLPGAVASDSGDELESSGLPIPLAANLRQKRVSFTLPGAVASDSGDELESSGLPIPFASNTEQTRVRFASAQTFLEPPTPAPVRVESPRSSRLASPRTTSLREGK